MQYLTLALQWAVICLLLAFGVKIEMDTLAMVYSFERLSYWQCYGIAFVGIPVMGLVSVLLSAWIRR